MTAHMCFVSYYRLSFYLLRLLSLRTQKKNIKVYLRYISFFCYDIKTSLLQEKKLLRLQTPYAVRRFTTDVNNTN